MARTLKIYFIYVRVAGAWYVAYETDYVGDLSVIVREALILGLNDSYLRYMLLAVEGSSGTHYDPTTYGSIADKPRLD